MRIALLGVIRGLLLLCMVAAAACDTVQQPASPTPDAMHPALEGAVAALGDARSFGFVESSAHRTEEFVDTDFEATGNFQVPDKFTKRALVREFPSEEAVSVRSIAVGDEKYLTGPATCQRLPLSSDLGLGRIYEEALFGNPVEFFSDVLSEGGPYAHQGITSLQGVRVNHFVSTTRRYAYTRAAGPLHIEVWIGAEDLLVRRITRSHSWTEVPCDPDLVCPDILVDSRLTIL